MPKNLTPAMRAHLDGETRLTPQGYFHAELRGMSQPLSAVGTIGLTVAGGYFFGPVGARSSRNLNAASRQSSGVCLPAVSRSQVCWAIVTW